MGASYAEAGGHLHVCILAAVTTTTASSLAPGTVLGGTYEIVRCIGSGGMGAVYEARHLRLEGRRVAVKVLLREVAESEESFARFRREAEIGARLGHPHIVAVTDFDKLDDGSPYLVMELLAGEDLSRRMGRGRVPETLTYRVVREVGGALAAAHKQGIVHRDLKPHNVFLVKVEEGEGVVEHCKVLDFGISKIAAAATVITRDAAVLGTPRYMAPEQALGKNDEIDGRTDQFALATVIYELLTGKPAFAADSSTAVLYKVVYEPAPPLREVAPQVPDEVCTAIERAMSKAPADRFPDMTSFVNAVLAGAGLGAGAMEVGLSTTKLEAGEAARRAAARRRTMLVTVGGGLLLQEWDKSTEDPARGRIVTKRRPSAGEMAALSFAWKIVKHVRSNAIDPGWVPTRMGGPSAPDDLEQGHVTQVWLAVSSKPDAMGSGGYWHHQRRYAPAPAVSDVAFQDRLLDHLTTFEKFFTKSGPGLRHLLHRPSIPRISTILERLFYT